MKKKPTYPISVKETKHTNFQTKMVKIYTHDQNNPKP